MEPRTSWLELIAAFTSVVVAVLLAIGIQRRDFNQRNHEMLLVTRAQESERKHALLARVLDVLESTVGFALGQSEADPDSAERVALRVRISNVYALIQSSGEIRDLVAGSWFELEALAIIDKREIPEPYQSVTYPTWLQLRSSTIRSNMQGWFDGTADPLTWSHY